MAIVDIILIHIASVKVTRLQCLLTLPAVLLFIHGVVLTARTTYILSNLWIWLVRWLNRSIFHSKVNCCNISVYGVLLTKGFSCCYDQSWTCSKMCLWHHSCLNCHRFIESCARKLNFANESVVCFLLNVTTSVRSSSIDHPLKFRWFRRFP